MSRIVLTTDRTLISEYRHIPLGDFAGCAPANRLPQALFDFIAPKLPAVNGLTLRAPYGLRKLEAALLKGFPEGDVVVAHPDYLENFIGPETKIVGVNTMDPLGLGPVSKLFTWGGPYFSYTMLGFYTIIKKIQSIRERLGSKFKVVVGGGGAWQFENRLEDVRRFKIDHVVLGEVDHIAPTLFEQIENDKLPELVKIRTYPKPEEIVPIVRPSLHGLVEVMRGCGRNCQFCEANLRIARYIPLETIKKELDVNTASGVSNAWVQSDDIFLYDVEDKRNFTPNRESLVNLFKTIMTHKGIKHSNPTHGSLAPAAADPLMMKQLSEILRSGPNRYIGIQPGLETGSIRLLKKYMAQKAKPFSVEEWWEVALQATKVFNENYWFPAYTLVLGLPGEEEEDIWDTVRLIAYLEEKLPKMIGEKAHFVVTPLSFVPVGVLRGKGFYNPKSFTEAEFSLLYRCWRHSLLEVQRLSINFFHVHPAFRAIFYPILRFGLYVAIDRLKAWGKSMGYDPDKPLLIKAN
ncbi:MAG: radical SAM protein [Nitrososphaerales archaeon]